MEKDFLTKVYGYSKIKEELFLIRQWYFDSNKLGEKKKLLPKGILFYGDPGEGKTLLMREYSKAFSYPVFIIEGNSENLESEITKSYDSARKEENAIVIIDELDTLVDKDEKLVRIIQSQLDGFKSEGNILTLATANNYNVLPEALLREGRFDRKFKVSINNKKDFYETIKGFSTASGLHFEEEEYLELVDDLNAYSASTIKAAFNSASLRYGDKCTINNVLDTLDFIETGFISKSSEFEVDRRSAIHEAGHTLYLKFFCKNQIFQRVYFDDDGGNTVFRNVKDYRSAEGDFESIRCGLAGIAAESIVYGKHGVGCADDLKKVNKLAFDLLNRQCIQKVDYFIPSSDYWGRREKSEKVNNITDKRIAIFLKKNYRFVLKKLRKHKKQIELLGDYLVEHHSIQKVELDRLLLQ